MKVNKYRILGDLVTLSMLAYAMRGNLGVVFIIFLSVFILFTNDYSKLVYCNKQTLLWSLFFIIFAFIGTFAREFEFTAYRAIAYVPIFLLTGYKDIWKSNKYIIRSLEYVGIFEAIGIILQKYLGTIYYPLLNILLINNGSEIYQRQLAGYITGFTREVAFAALFLIIAIGIEYSNIKAGINKRKSILLLLLFLFCLLQTGKRSHLIICLLTLYIIGFSISNDKYKVIKYTFITAIIIIAGIISINVFKNVPTFKRLYELYYELTNNNDITIVTNGRNVLYDHAIELWQEHKIFGIGWGNYRYTLRDNTYLPLYDAHNCYLQVLCECGMVGAIIFYLLMVNLIINVFSNLIKLKNCNNKNEILFHSYYVLFFSIYCFTGTNLYEYSWVILFYIGIINIYSYKVGELNDTIYTTTAIKSKA